MRKFLIVLLVAALFLAISGPHQPHAEASPPFPHGQWDWLKGTNWYVPEDFLPAIQTDLKTLKVEEVLDQTVFHIDDSSNGYFWGFTAAQIITHSPPPTRCLLLVGSVTPDGSLNLTFTPILPGVPAALLPKTTGIGRMRRMRGQWTMQLQMTAGMGLTKELTHWAFMAQCPPRAVCILPGLKIPLRKFLDNCR